MMGPGSPGQNPAYRITTLIWAASGLSGLAQLFSWHTQSITYQGPLGGKILHPNHALSVGDSTAGRIVASVAPQKNQIKKHHSVIAKWCFFVL